MSRRIPILPIALLALALAGCERTKTPLPAIPSDEAFEVTSTIPHLHQTDVVLSSGILVVFPSDVDPATIDGKVALAPLEDGAPTGDVPITATATGPSILVKPATLLAPLTLYQLTLRAGVAGLDGRASKTDRVVTFETGVRRPNAAEPIAVLRAVPGPDDTTWDVSTFRVYFTEPVARPSLVYGTSVRFEDAETGDLLPGNLLGRGNQIVFDPDNDLTPGKTYRLVVTTALQDRNDQHLGEEFVAEFVPESSGPRTQLFMDNCPTAVGGKGGFCDAVAADELPANRFTGRPTNTMFADSILLGGTNIPVGGGFLAEFGDTKAHPACTPFVLRKGQRIYGASLDAALGGEIPTGVISGDINITLAADGVGEMAGSEFVHGVAGLPPAVTMSLDVVMTLRDPVANAIMGQTFLGVQIVGLVDVRPYVQDPDYEAMHIELAGFTEIILAGETTPVSFSMLQVPPTTMRAAPVDVDPPAIAAVSPVPDATRVMLDDEAIVMFGEPIDPDTVAGNFRVVGPAGEVPGVIDFYSPQIAFRPTTPWQPLSTYTIEVGAGIKDLSGNAIAAAQSFSFTTNSAHSSPVEPPLVAATVPGEISLPKNFVLSASFTQLIDPASLDYGVTYGLYELGGRLVSGTPLLSPRWLQFVPDEELTEGQEYQWIFTGMVTNVDGVELDTDFDRVPGGLNFVVPFTAGPSVDAVQSLLYTYPIADTDGSGYLDGRETPTDTNLFAIDFELVTGPSYSVGYQPITISRMIHDDDGSPRLPIAVESAGRIFATSTGIGLPTKAEPGLLDMGRITVLMTGTGRADIVPAPDGLAGVDVNLGTNFSVENDLINGLLVHDLTMAIPSTLRFTADGRMIVFIEGQTTVQMDIPVIGLLDMPTTVDMTTVSIPTVRAY